MQKLKEVRTPYRISNNGATISVPEDKVAELRLEMAGAGVPKSGRIGFEIFDKTNFGMTDFAEHVNYRRALEGELERSVMSVVEIEQARVHISLPQDSVFLEARQPAKASVLVKIRPGASLPETAMPAITNLVASAVEGLSAGKCLGSRYARQSAESAEATSGRMRTILRTARSNTGTRWSRTSRPSSIRRSNPWLAPGGSAPRYPPSAT